NRPFDEARIGRCCDGWKTICHQNGVSAMRMQCSHPSVRRRDPGKIRRCSQRRDRLQGMHAEVFDRDGDRVSGMAQGLPVEPIKECGLNSTFIVNLHSFRNRLKLFLALSRTPHGLLDMATPAMGALLWL